MHSPAQAILWQIFWRCRWGFASAAAFLLLAIALSHMLPRHWTIQVGDDEVPAVGWFFGVSCLFVNIMLIAAFSMSGADARNLTFAKHMFVLPVRTSTLVAWPLISGCLTVAAFWLINASLVFRANRNRRAAVVACRGARSFPGHVSGARLDTLCAALAAWRVDRGRAHDALAGAAAGALVTRHSAERTRGYRGC